MLGHLWDGLVILEFEPVDRAGPPDFRHLYALLGHPGVRGLGTPPNNFWLYHMGPQ